jgi:hypothetical protein
MGGARKVAAKRSKRGVSRSNGRGKRQTTADRVDADADLSRSERSSEDAIDPSLGHGCLADSGETDNQETRYGRLRLKAERALSVLIDAPAVPANVRSAAIRTALELVGAIGVRSKNQQNNDENDLELDPERLTVEDIDREIYKLGRV